MQVLAHCYRQDEMLNMIQIANEFGFKIRSFGHAVEGYKVASELAVSVVVADGLILQPQTQVTHAFILGKDVNLRTCLVH